MPSPIGSPARIASVTYALARTIASSSERPCASWVAIAAEYVQPGPVSVARVQVLPGKDAHALPRHEHVRGRLRPRDVPP